jgi:hypothetical protein
VELRHRYAIAGSGSGSIFIDNVFFRELPAAGDPRWLELLPFGSVWRYTVSEPAANWSAVDFDDSGWEQAPAKFGGGTGTAGVVTPLVLMQPAYYFRRTFTNSGSQFEEFLLAATATDDFNGQTYPLRVFLNGQELGAAGVEAVTGTGTPVKYFDLLPFADLLRPGENIIAVKLQNGWANDWDNVAMDLSLRAVPVSASSGLAQFTSIYPEPKGMVTLRISGPEGTSWRLECADSPWPSSSWQTVQSRITVCPTGVTVTDSSGPARTRWQWTGARFYRLVRQ